MNLKYSDSAELQQLRQPVLCTGSRLQTAVPRPHHCCLGRRLPDSLCFRPPTSSGSRGKADHSSRFSSYGRVQQPGLPLHTADTAHVQDSILRYLLQEDESQPIPSFFPSQRSSFDYFRCRPRVTQIDTTLESIRLPASELRHTKYASKLTGKPELPGQG